MFVVDGDLQIVGHGLFEDEVQDRIRPIRLRVVPPGHRQRVDQRAVHLLHVLLDDGRVPGIVGADQRMQALQPFLAAALGRRLDPVVLAEPDVVVGQDHLVREGKALGRICGRRARGRRRKIQSSKFLERDTCCDISPDEG